MFSPSFSGCFCFPKSTVRVKRKLFLSKSTDFLTFEVVFVLLKIVPSLPSLILINYKKTHPISSSPQNFTYRLCLCLLSPPYVWPCPKAQKAKACPKARAERCISPFTESYSITLKSSNSSLEFR